MRIRKKCVFSSSATMVFSGQSKCIDTFNSWISWIEKQPTICNLQGWAILEIRPKNISNMGVSLSQTFTTNIDQRNQRHPTTIRKCINCDVKKFSGLKYFDCNPLFYSAGTFPRRMVTRFKRPWRNKIFQTNLRKHKCTHMVATHICIFHRLDSLALAQGNRFFHILHILVCINRNKHPV